MQIVAFLQEIGISGFLDIVFMTLIVYVALVLFKKTKAAFIVIGIFIVGGVYLLARQFNLSMTTAVFHSFFTVSLIALLIIFQEEIRYIFERVAVWSLNPQIGKRKAHRMARPEVDLLVRTLFDLAREKIGALIVVRGKDLIMRYLDGGTDLNGEISEPLLKSLFDPHSIGHDGAVIIEQNRLAQFSAHLPLSKNLTKIGKGGTRHAAALGLAEKTDALCLVVSEERGTVSVARAGDLWVIQDPAELSRLMEEFYQSVAPRQERKWQEIFQRNYREKILALGIALVLWFVLAYGSNLIYKTYEIPVRYSGLAQELTVTQIRPETVKVSFSGPRRHFYLISRLNMRLTLNASEWQGGKRTVRLSESDLTFPEGIILRDILPRDVVFHIGKVAEKEKGEKS